MNIAEKQKKFKVKFMQSKFIYYTAEQCFAEHRLCLNVGDTASNENLGYINNNININI